MRETNQAQPENEQVAALQAQVEVLEEAADEDQFSAIVGGALGAVIVMLALLILFRFRKLL